MLDMPNYNDHSTTPPTPSIIPHTPALSGPEGEVEDVIVQHAQFNSPLKIYSEDNMKEAFAIQTEGAQPQVQR